jgi:cell wall-associated NlpC family hydrolase
MARPARSGTFRHALTRLIWTAALAVLTTACASTGAVPQPFPTPGRHTSPGGGPNAPDSPASPGPSGSPSPPGSPSAPVTLAKPVFDGYALVGTALSFRGAPYRNGGSDPTGFDCSGFTQYVFGRYGIALPRDVKEQYRQGKTVKPEDLEAGDLVFFTTTDPGVSHVGIAVGGDEFVHAPSSTGVVRVERLSSRYWADRFLVAKRVAH